MLWTKSLLFLSVIFPAICSFQLKLDIASVKTSAGKLEHFMCYDYIDHAVESYPALCYEYNFGEHITGKSHPYRPDREWLFIPKLEAKQFSFNDSEGKIVPSDSTHLRARSLDILRSIYLYVGSISEDYRVVFSWPNPSAGNSHLITPRASVYQSALNTLLVHKDEFETMSGIVLYSARNGKSIVAGSVLERGGLHKSHAEFLVPTKYSKSLPLQLNVVLKGSFDENVMVDIRGLRHSKANNLKLIFSQKVKAVVGQKSVNHSSVNIPEESTLLTINPKKLHLLLFSMPNSILLDIKFLPANEFRKIPATLKLTFVDSLFGENRLMGCQLDSHQLTGWKRKESGFPGIALTRQPKITNFSDDVSHYFPHKFSDDLDIKYYVCTKYAYSNEEWKLDGSAREKFLLEKPTCINRKNRHYFLLSGGDEGDFLCTDFVDTYIVSFKKLGLFKSMYKETGCLRFERI